MLRPLPITLVPADAELAWEAGRLQSITSEIGLSLGDRFSLAVAKLNDLPAWTADRRWKELAEAVAVKIVVIG